VIALARGLDASGSGQSTYAPSNTLNFRTFNTHTGRITVTSEDVNNRTVVARLQTGGCSRLDFSAFVVTGYIAAGSGVAHGNKQNTALVQVYWNGTVGASDDTTFSDIDIGAPVEITNNSQWITGLYIQGQDSAPFVKILNTSVNDIRVARVKDGIRIGSSNGAVVSNSYVDSFCKDAVFLSGASNSYNSLEDLILCRPFQSVAEPDEHNDFVQIGSSTVGENWVGNTVRRVFCIGANGNGLPQGVFMDDVSYNSGAPTGFFQNNTTVEGLFYDGIETRGLSLDAGSGYDLRYATVIRGDAVNVAPGDYGTPTLSAPVSPDLTATGVARQNVFQRAASAVVATLDFDSSNKVLRDISVEPAWGPSSQVGRVAYYEQFFQAPDTEVLDYANMTPSQLVAEMRAAYAPIYDGDLKLDDGRYSGAFFPDGSWNDGTVYEATPPTAITSSTSVATAEVGEPIDVTFQLDAAANLSVEINPSVSGVTGSFTPDPVTVGVGEGSATTSLVATSAGTATISASNNRSLSGPSNLALTITTPDADPTTYTQTLSASSTTVSASVQITYTLDQVATAGVVITPASNLNGSFSSPTVAIPFGSQAAQVTYTPSVQGAHTLSATNDSSLLNPQNANLLVANTNVAQLIVLGIRPSL
jgi:hypothetical protein